MSTQTLVDNCGTMIRDAFQETQEAVEKLAEMVADHVQVSRTVSPIETNIKKYEAMLEREFDPKTGERHRRPMTFIPDASAMLAVQNVISDLSKEKSVGFLTGIFDQSTPADWPDFTGQ